MSVTAIVIMKNVFHYVSASDGPFLVIQSTHWLSMGYIFVTCCESNNSVSDPKTKSSLCNDDPNTTPNSQFVLQ